MEEEV